MSTPMVTFATQLSSMQSSQWIMVTIVSEQAEANTVNNTLYINGRKADSNTSRVSSNNGARNMMIGGRTGTSNTSGWSDPMKIDNVRLYSVALTEEEVAEIYARERRPSPITVSPSSLAFIKSMSKLDFVIKNNTSIPTNFTINDDMEVIKYTPSSGFLQPNGSETISLSIPNRDELPAYRRGTIIVVADGAHYAVDVEIEPGANTQTDQIAVRRGLQAYYNFDNSTTDDNYQDYYTGQNNGGTFIDDTPNGKGKSLLLRQKQYVSIGYALIDGKKNFSFSFWVKDFGTACPIKAIDNNYLYGPSVFVGENQRITYYTNKSNMSNPFVEFQSDLTPYQNDKWTMITIVTEQQGTSNTVVNTLYINGCRSDVEESSASSNSGASNMTIGGQMDAKTSSSWSDPMKIDNIRLYSVALTDEEVAAIYAAERQQ